MKKITLLFALCGFVVSMDAQYPQSLPIDYNAFFAASAMGTDPVLEKAEYQTTSDAILANQWNRSGKLTSGEGGGSSPLVENSTLSYSNYVDNNVGKAIVLDPTLASLTLRSTIYSLTSGNEYRGKAFYVSVLVNFSSAPTSANDFFAWDANHTANSQRGRVFVKSVTEGIQFGLGYNGQPTVWSSTLNLNETHLIVLKVTPVSTGDEVFSMYVNPQINETEESTASLLTTITQPAALKQIRGITVRQRPSIGGKLAGIRFSDNWTDVVKASSVDLPKLSSPVVGSASSVGAESFIANWTAVVNATGYAVKVYQGETLHGTYDADGQSTESLFIRGLMTNTAYTYKVIAKGDAIDYSNSEESAASLLFTTLEGLTSIETDFSDETWGTLYTSENQPASGSFPSSYHNGFEIENTFLYDISKYDSRGERKDYGLRMDRMSNGGMVVLPTVKSLEQVEIHAIPGGAPRSITLKELVDGIWTTIGTYEMTSSVDYKEFIIPLSRAVPTKLRIENAGSGQVTLYQIITRTTNPTLLDAPVVGVASAVNSNHFTANWTAVANATGYKVRVYQGTTIVKTVDVSGQATESVQVTELSPETEYTFKVLAVGDAFVNYADSYLSAASTPFTTGITSGLDNLSELKLTVSGKTIMASESGMFEVYNMQGAKLHQVKNTVMTETNLPAGLYILQFTDMNGKQATQKISIN